MENQDVALTRKVLKRKILKLEGVDVTKENLEDLALENVWLKGEKSKLQQENAGLSQKLTELNVKKGKSNFVREVIKTFKFPRKQKNLLWQLRKLEPVENSELSKLVGTKNLKSLIRDTNDKLDGYGSKGSVVIKSCKDMGLRGYHRLSISAPTS